MPNEVEITITGKDVSSPAFDSAMGNMIKLKAAAKALNSDFHGLWVPPDPNKISSSLTVLRQRIQSLGIADIADVNVQPGVLMAKLMILKRLVQQAGISDLVDMNVNDSKVSAQLARISNMSASIPVTFDVQHQDIPYTFKSIGGVPMLGAASEKLAITAGAARDLAKGFGEVEKAKDSLSDDVEKKLNPAVKKAGGNFLWWGGLFTRTLGGIGLWHIALDGILEATVAVTGAALAAGVGIAGMAPAAQDVALNLKSVFTVSQSLGQSIPPLTGRFNDLAQSLAPQVIEDYGGALFALNRKTGAFGQTAHQVTDLVNNWVAKLDIWDAKQKGMGQLLNSGVGFLSQFGSILGHVGIALDNLIKADPGTAKVLLDVIDGFIKILDFATRIPRPLLETAMAMHAFYIWGSVAGGILEKLPGRFGGLGRAVTSIMHNKALLAFVAIGGELAINWDKASSQVQDSIDKINSSISSMSASDAIIGIGRGIGDLNNSIKNINTQGIIQSWGGIGSVFQETDAKFRAFGHDIAETTRGSFLHQLDSLGNAIKMIFDPGFAASSAASGQVQDDIGKINAAIDQLRTKQSNLFAETGRLIKQGYSYSQALALMDLAGVRAGDSLQVMGQKVHNLVMGYQNLIGKGGVLTNSVNAVNFAALQQESQVNALNGGWDAFIGTITGGEGALLTIAQDLDAVAKNGLAIGGSMDQFNSKFVQQQQSWQTAINDANTYIDKLTLLASASGGGSKSTGLLVKGTKDLIQLLLPAAKGSETLTSELYALAQRGGYTGANSFKALALWVGNTKDPMKQLNDITTTLTKNAGNLTDDVRALSTALGTNLNQAMAGAIFVANGGEKVFDNFASAVLKTGDNSIKTRDSAQKLAFAMYDELGHNVNLTKDEFLTFARAGLGLTKKEADILWQETLPKLQQKIDSLHGKDVVIRLTADATGAIRAAIKGTGSSVSNAILQLSHMAGGGRVPGFGGGDSFLTLLEPGEAVVDKWRTRRIAPFLRSLGVPGFASGGIVGAPGWIANRESDLGSMATRDLFSDIKNLWNGAFIGAPFSGGPPSSAPNANARLAQSMYPAYASGPVWNAWNYLAMRESGWNQFAVNPSSGAYGIPQALPFSKMPVAAWPSWAGGMSDPRTQIQWMWNYMAGTYGGPVGAASHERQFNWYDDGGWLRPGPNYMWNGTGKPEYLSRQSPDRCVQLEVVGGQSMFERFMAEFIRDFVKAKGGGIVQNAFGERGKV